MADYRLALASLGTGGLGSVIVEDLFAGGYPEGGPVLSYTDALNAPGSITFSLPVDTAEIGFDDPGKCELHLYRDEVLWRTYRLWVGSLESRVSVRFAGEGFYGVLRRRNIREDKVYNDLNGGPFDQFDIAWDLIDYTQGLPSGGIGITRESAATSGITRQVFWCAGDSSIADAIEELAAAIDGFDFDISPGKEWRVWSPRRGSDTALVFDAETNVEDISGLDVDATQVESDVAAFMDTGDCEPPDIITSQDAGALADYGLLHGSITAGDADLDQLQDDEDLVQAQVDEELRIGKVARIQPVMSYHLGPAALPDVVPLEAFELGDRVTGQASLGWATFSQTFRIIQVDVDYLGTGQELVKVTLDRWEEGS